MQWFRMYAEFATDPVAQSLSFDDQRHFVMVLCLKCAGLLDRKFGHPQARIEVLKKILGLDGMAFQETRQRLETIGLIDGDWQPRNWDKRQFISDRTDPTAAERMRRFRVRNRNGPRNSSRNSTVTLRPSESDTDTDTDTEQKKPRSARARLTSVGENPRTLGTNPRAIAEGLDPEAWQRWIVYRSDIRKPIKPASLLAAQQKLAGFGTSQSAVVEQSIANGWQGLFPLKSTASVREKPVQTWRPPPDEPDVQH